MSVDKIINLSIFGKDFCFVTHSELFSPNQLDSGTKFLLKSIQITAGAKNILDLGCGWGAIGIILAKLHTKSKIVLTDQDGLALKITKENILENKISNAVALLPNNVEEKSFDFVLSNLPWHKNISAVPGMIKQAFDSLKVGGKFYAVINQQYRTRDKIEEIFCNVEIIAQNGSYKVLSATKLSGKIDPLREKVLSQLQLLKINPDLSKDQNFLVSSSHLDKIIKESKIKKTETILEIGAGLGQMTEKLALLANKVVALEIDERMKIFLDQLPKNVEVRYGNAWNIIGHRMSNIDFDKVISNIPYSLCEPLAHKLAHAKTRPIYLVLPEKFVERLKDHFIFAAVFEIKVLFKIPRAYFYPMPKTDSCCVYLCKYSGKITNENLSLWVRRFIYQNEGKILKNILCLAIEKISKDLKKVTLTKNQTREIIETFGIDPQLLKRNQYSAEAYHQASNAITKYFKVCYCSRS